ncbi:MAG: branched-chain amino acid ABC transporter permease [Halobacteria archaeon]|nr:branched-chain amino acid ABC transporter permease [Candidatus Bathyarchaeota archaeon]
MISPELIVTAILNGLSIAMTLALVALGMGLIFGLMHVPNFAQGNFFALGAYMAFSIAVLTGNFWLAIPIGALCVALTGFLFEPVLLRRMYGRPIPDILIIMYGILLITYDTIEVIWGSVGLPVNTPPELAGAIPMALVEYPAYRMFQIVFSGIVCIVFYLFLKKTKIGLLIRAGVQDRGMVQALGININKIFLTGFCIGIGMAGLGGVIVAPFTQVFPLMGNEIIIKIFVVVVLGGIGSFRGTLLAALILGWASAFSALVWPPLSEIVIFFILGATLIARPGGILGEGEEL